MDWQSIEFECCSYNPLERREVCKGGREGGKKSAQSQASTKASSAPKSHSSSHAARRNDASSANATNPAAKASRPSSAGGPAYDEQVCFLFFKLKNMSDSKVYCIFA